MFSFARVTPPPTQRARAQVILPPASTSFDVDTLTGLRLVPPSFGSDILAGVTLPTRPGEPYWTNRRLVALLIAELMVLVAVAAALLVESRYQPRSDPARVSWVETD